MSLDGTLFCDLLSLQFDILSLCGAFSLYYIIIDDCQWGWGVGGGGGGAQFVIGTTLSTWEGGCVI